MADILGHPVGEADYRAVPRVTFTDPEIGSVGMTEAQARESGGEVRVMSEPIAQSARGWINKGEGLVKLIEMDGVLVGATSMGPCGGEVLAALTLAVHARIPVSTMKGMIFALPDFSPGHRFSVVVLTATPSLTAWSGRPIWRELGVAATRGDPRRGRR